MKDIHTLFVERDEYAELLQLCRLDPEFPKSWEQWVSLVSEARINAGPQGFNQPVFRITPEEFKAWCATTGFVPCMDALRAYAIAKRLPRDTILQRSKRPSA